MRPLEELRAAAQRLGSAEAFCAVYPQAALTVRMPGEGEAPATFNLNETCDDEGVLAMFGDPSIRTHVAFMVKTDRNPFGHLITVGRGSNNDIQLPHPSVSKVHAVFMQVGESWKVTERSKNGLFVDRMPVESGGSRDVRDGSILSFGIEVEATFHTPSGLYQALIR